jgi:hypothetical protein
MALANATWDGQKIVTVVSRFTGLANDTNSRAAVLDYINLGLWEISLHTPWDWLATVQSDITVSASVATYSLATADFGDVYNARLTGNLERTLTYVDQRTYDKIISGNQDAAGTPTHYTVYGAQKNALIKLLPTPSAADTLQVRYTTQQSTISDATASSLAIADKFMPMVIYKAAELGSAWKNPELVTYWKAKYDEVLARSINVDRVKADENPQIIAAIEHGQERIDPINPTDTAFYPV